MAERERDARVTLLYRSVALIVHTIILKADFWNRMPYRYIAKMCCQVLFFPCGVAPNFRESLIEDILSEKCITSQAT